MKQFIPENGIFVFFRYNKDKMIMVVTNNNDSGKDLKLNRFSEMLSAKTNAIELTSGKSFILQESLSIPAKSVQIFEIN